jgi:hypothetical protein
MSGSHPIASRLDSHVDDPTRLLATVMLLPLVDGIFPALVLAGALDSVVGVLQVGILVFGGSATLAVILTELQGTRRSQVRTVLLVGVPLVSLAAIEAALAPTIAKLLNLEVFARFAALVVGAIAAKTASARVGEWLPRPGAIIALGFVASLQPSQAMSVTATPTVDLVVVAQATAAGLVGVGFALGVALLGPRLRAAVRVERFRFGSAVALGLLALSIVGFPFGQAPLAVIAVTAVFTYDPSFEEQSGPAPGDAVTGDGGADTAEAALADGGAGNRDPDEETAPVAEPTPAAGGDDDGDGSLDGERPPWL